MTECNFITIAGNCPNAAVRNFKYCEKHKDLSCIRCGMKATHQCSYGSFICGAYLCNNCEHRPNTKQHRRKGKNAY